VPADKLPVADNTQVTLHFAIKLTDGTVVDSNFGGQPATFSPGDGNLLPGFEQVLMGLKAGDKQCFRLPPEQAFGQPNPKNKQVMAKQRFTQQSALEPGLVLNFGASDEGQLPGVVTQVGTDTVEIDFNHPLAGRTLFFEVDIRDVQPVKNNQIEVRLCD
jgi:FKBP-type peptidyl-prolyl cis-trans isomerase SlpA